MLMKCHVLIERHLNHKNFGPPENRCVTELTKYAENMTSFFNQLFHQILPKMH